MPLLSEFAEEYAQAIRDAVRRDRIVYATKALRNRNELAHSHLAAELQRVGEKLSRIVYTGTNTRLSEEDRRYIAEETGRRLEFEYPERMLEIIGKASVQNFLAILGDIEAILNRVK